MFQYPRKDTNAMTQFDKVAQNAAKKVGMTLENLRNASVDEIRREIETKNKKSLSFTSEFPVIGRGNVLRDRLLTTSQIDAEIDKILK